MQSVLSRIWTHVAVSISYDDNHYTTGTSLCIKNDVWYIYKAYFCEAKFVYYSLTSTLEFVWK